MAVANKCSKCVPPILRQCFLLNHIIDGNITTTYTYRMQPKAQDLQQHAQPVKYCMEDYSLKEKSRICIHSFNRSKPCVKDLFNGFNQGFVYKTNDVRILRSTKFCIGSQPQRIAHPPTAVYSRPVNESNGSKNTKCTSTPNTSPSSAQLSFVLLKLREELPNFFVKHHSFDMYDMQLKFINTLFPLPIYLRTRTAYKLYLGFCRYLTIALYSNASFELIKITKEDESGEIKARWRIRGSSRVIPWLSDRVILDGFSTFFVNIHGKVFLHKAEKMMPSTKEKNRLSIWFSQIGFITGHSTPGPAKINDLTNC